MVPKVRESGMPEEDLWASFFDPEGILDAFGVDENVLNAVEFGCGYGNFTLPLAQRICGRVKAFDIDPDMILATASKCRTLGCWNVQLLMRDFALEGTGLRDQSVDLVLLFHILHHERPHDLLKEACRVLKPGGRALVMHWNPDSDTPRGPPMDMRPRPQECLDWGRSSGFAAGHGKIMALSEWHYGLVLTK